MTAEDWFTQVDRAANEYFARPDSYPECYVRISPPPLVGSRPNPEEPRYYRVQYDLNGHGKHRIEPVTRPYHSEQTGVPIKIEDAITLAKLWRAGKMIGGNEDDVRNALLAEVERAHDLCAKALQELKVLRAVAVRAEFVLLEQRREFARGEFSDLDELEDALNAGIATPQEAVDHE